MFIRHELYSPDGSLLWSGQPADSDCNDELLTDLHPGPLRAVVSDLLARARQIRHTSIAAITRECERLEMLTRVGCAPGFVTVLPRGKYLDRAVEAMNAEHAARLDAVTIEFPLVFERGQEDMAALTASYESHRRMFRVDGSDRQMRLAYAADPGLFNFLRGRQLAAGRLPYVIYSPMPAFRRRLSGETDLLTLNQYTLPDLHALCQQADARDTYAMVLREAAVTSRFAFGDSCAQFLEIAPELHDRHSDLASDLARSARQFTVARYLDGQRRYFSLKGGIDVHSSAGPVMIFNFQWDETNGRRFGIRTDSGQDVTVIHSTLAGGWPKVLPIVIGQALAGWKAREVPAEYSPDAVTVLPVKDAHVPTACAVVDSLLTLGVSAVLGEVGRRSIGARVHRLRERWRPFHVVIGEREASGAAVRLVRTVTGQALGIEEFIAAHGERLRRFQPVQRSIRTDLPFRR